MCIIEWRTPSNIPNMQSEILKAFLKKSIFSPKTILKNMQGPRKVFKQTGANFGNSFGKCYKLVQILYYRSHEGLKHLPEI